MMPGRIPPALSTQHRQHLADETPRKQGDCMGDWRSGEHGERAGDASLSSGIGPTDGLLATAELVAASEPGLLGCAADGRLTYVDARAAALLGRPAAELVAGCSISDVLDRAELTQAAGGGAADSSVVLRDALAPGRSAHSWTIVDAAGEPRELLL